MAHGSNIPASHSHTEAEIIDLAHADPDAIHDDTASEISAVTAKATPVGADLLLLEDSAASYAKKRSTVTNVFGGVPVDTLSDVAAHTPTKGNVLVADGTNWQVLAVGTNGYLLTADSAESTGVKWAAGSGGGGGDLQNDQSTAAVDFSETTAVTIFTTNVTSMAAGDVILVEVWGMLNNNTGTNRTWTAEVDYDSQFAAALTQASVDSNSAQRQPFWWRGVMTVIDSSNASAWNIWYFDDLDITLGAAWRTLTGSSAPRQIWDDVAADLTGTVTVTFTLYSDSTGATQDVDYAGWTVRKLS